MDRETALRAHNVISIALGATTYRATSDEALSVANIPAGTVVTERATHALSDNAEMQVTLQLSNGDVWSLATWDSDDAHGVLCEALAFIRRYTETQSATAEDPEDCAYCSGNGSPHCDHGEPQTCHACNGDGAFPSRSGGHACECCEGTGHDTGCQCPGCHASRTDDNYPGDDACGVCNGTGSIYHSRAVGNRPCPSCNGAGTN